MVKASLVAVTGLICAATLAIGFGFVVPVSSVVGELFNVLAVGLVILFVGLLDGEQRLENSKSASGFRA
jgi:hypothetical protein